MKRFNLYLCLLASLGTMVSCEKNTLNINEFTDVSDQAQVKVNIFSFYRANPNLQIKVNDQRVSNSLAANTPFPGGGLNTGGGSTADYLAVTPGSAKISFGLPKAGTNQDSVLVNQGTFTFNQGVKYSVYFADTAANATSLLVIDSLKRPDSGFARYKFINLIPDLPSADLYIGTTKIASAVPYKGVSPSFVLPTNNASTTWAIRTAGGTTNLVTYPGAATSISNQRVYTVVARGYNSITTTSTAEPRRRAISLIYNL